MNASREASEDMIALTLAVALILAAISVYLCATSFGTGGKYWLLNTFGREARGQIIDVRTQNFRDREEWLSYALRDPAFRWAPGKLNETYKIFIIKYPVSPDVTEQLVVTRPMQDLRLDGLVDADILYLPWREQIAYPASLLDDFFFDAKLLAGASLALLLLTLLSIRTIRVWVLFRRGAKRY